MKSIINIASLVFALALGLFSLSAQAAFTGTMTDAQVQAEITAMLAQTDPATGQPYSLVQVAQAAQAAGVTPASFTTAAVSGSVVSTTAVYTAITVWGQSAAPAVVSAAIVAAPASAGAIVSMALQVAPAQITAIQTAGVAAAVQVGVSPTVVTTATAAGGAAAGAAAGTANAAGGTGVTVAPLICSGVSRC